MVDERLKRCPFCGGRADVWRTNYHVFIQCENWNTQEDRGHIIQVSAKTEAEAIELWQGKRSN